MNRHEQTKARIFRATVRYEDAMSHMANLNLIPGKGAYVAMDGKATTLFWAFLTPSQAAMLRGLSVTLDDTSVSETVDMAESVQAL